MEILYHVDWTFLDTGYCLHASAHLSKIHHIIISNFCNADSARHTSEEPVQLQYIVVTGFQDSNHVHIVDFVTLIEKHDLISKQQCSEL